jgi:hypothetical protein
MDPLLLVLSCTSFYVELRYFNILKYLFKLIQFILKLLLFFESYAVIYTGFYVWAGVGRMMRMHSYTMCFRNVVLCGGVGIVWVYVVGATVCTCVILDQNGVFLIFGPRWPRVAWLFGFWWLVLLDVLWWTRWSCSYLFFYIGMSLHVGVVFMVLLPGFLLTCSLVASTDVLYLIVFFGLSHSKNAEWNILSCIWFT